MHTALKGNAHGPEGPRGDSLNVSTLNVESMTKAERRIINLAMKFSRDFRKDGFLVMHGKGPIAELVRACLALKAKKR